MRGMARGYAAGDSRGPGWREIAGTLGQLQAGRQAGSGMACSRAKARLNWVSQGQRRGRCKVRRRAERVIRPTSAQRIGVRRCSRRLPARKRPASASCPQCSPVPARRRGQGDGRRVPAGPGAGRGWPAGAGRHWPPGDGRQRGCGYGRDCSVAASSFFKGCPQGRPSVDSG